MEKLNDIQVTREYIDWCTQYAIYIDMIPLVFQVPSVRSKCKFAVATILAKN